jgi:hypothetical protein
MYSQENDTAFEVLNAVIWRLYEKGYHLAAREIENKRDKEAIMAYDKGLEKQVDRCKLYAELDARHAKLKLNDNRNALEVITQINQMATLAKVYFIFVSNPDKLRKINTIGELYNRVAFSYLHTFEGWRGDMVLNVKNLGDVRSAFSTVERCVRFIKADRPEMFNPDLVKESGKKHSHTTENHGNNLGGL